MLSRKKTTPILAGVLGGLLTSVVIGNWQRERPNVVMVVVDSLRGDAITDVIGAAHIPNLRALIGEGVAFPLAFSHSPDTVAAHTALESGMLPFELGVTGDARDVRPDIPLLPEWMRDHGYQTAAAVSLSELWKPASGDGLTRGFQLYEQGEHPVENAESVNERLTTILDSLDPNDPFFLLAHFSDPHGPHDDHGRAPRTGRVLVDDRAVEELVVSQNCFWSARLDLSPGEHLLEFSSDAPLAIRDFRFESAGRALPYELRVGDFEGGATRVVVALQNPTDAAVAVDLGGWIHDVPTLEELRDRYRQEVEAVDHAIGELVAELRLRGLYDETIIIVTAGHGAALGEHDTIGQGLNLFDEQLHVPLIVRLPEGWDERVMLVSNSPEQVRLVDVAPTLLELCDLPFWEGIDGASLLCEAKRPLIAQVVAPGGGAARLAMRDQLYKLVLDPAQAEGDGFEMFRLGSDPLELDNVFGHQGHLRKEWQAQLRAAAEALILR